MSEHAISLKSIELSLGQGVAQVHVLRGIDLDIGQGASIGVTGPSGSGKSTLLMIMAGLERPGSGQVMLNGHDLSSLSEDGLAEIRGQSCGIVFQSFHLLPTMTALENVAVPLELTGQADPLDRARAELDAVGLSERLHHYPAQLSGGEQQRVALARALVHQPSVLFADEPTGNLDSKTGAQIADLLFELPQKRGATLVLVTHDEALAQRCDRVLRLADGKIISDTLMTSGEASGDATSDKSADKSGDTTGEKSGQTLLQAS